MSERPSPPTGANVDRSWLHRFAVETRTLTLADLTRANTCILTTRIGLGVLERLGVPARATPVYVSVFNMEAWLLAERGVPVSEWPPSAHSVGIDSRSELPDWNGHLVLMVKQPGEPRLLIDLTGDQFDRPHVGIVVGGPVFMGIPNGATWTPQDPLTTRIPDAGAGESIVCYWPMPPGHPDAKAWREAPDWAQGQEYVDAAVRAILDRLARQDPAAETG